MIRFSRSLLIGALAGVAGLLGSCASLSDLDSSRLTLVQQRGELLCGVSGKIPGFSFLSPEGRYSGLDVDVCHAMAAHFSGIPAKFSFVS